MAAARLVALLVAFGCVLIVRPAAASLGTAGVVAVGGGVALVEDAGRIHVFALADGRLRETVELPVPIYEVHYDGRRSEFWGGSWKDGPVVWSWRPGGAFRIERIPAGEIHKTFAMQNGERLLAVTRRAAGERAAIEDEEGNPPPVVLALAKWDGRLLRLNADLLPPDDMDREGAFVVMGAQALFSGFVDLASGRPVTPNVAPYSKEPGFFVWRASPGRWVLAESGDGRLLESLDDGKTWRKKEYLTGQVLAGTFFAFEGDPFRPGDAYALIHVDVDVDGVTRLELWRSPTGGLGWRSVWREPEDPFEEEQEPGAILFDSEAVWVQRTLLHSDGGWSIRLTGISRSRRSAPRALTLRLRPLAAREESDSVEISGSRPVFR